MPVFPEDRFVQAVVETVRANSQWVPPYGSGATLYVRPFMFGSDAIIGVKPATEYQFRVFVTRSALFQGRHQAPEAADFRS